MERGTTARPRASWHHHYHFFRVCRAGPTACEATGIRPRAGRTIPLLIVFCAVTTGLSFGFDSASSPAAGNETRTLGDLSRGVSGEDAEAVGGSYAREYLRVLGWLSLVVVLAAGTLFALKRVYPGAASPGAPNAIDVIARRALTPKQQILVVRVGERGLILGVSPERIDRIGELNDPRELIPLSAPQSFSQVLTEQDSEYREAEAPQPDLGPYQREIDRLKKMVGNWRLSMTREGSR